VIFQENQSLLFAVLAFEICLTHTIGMKYILLFLIKLYQFTISPDHGLPRYIIGHGTCRFYPSCSQYTYEAIKTYGSGRGVVLGLKRLSRCHPWHPGGVDPVPQVEKKSTEKEEGKMKKR
jgi:putative membrane protein insertion efficiency factor